MTPGRKLARRATAIAFACLISAGLAPEAGASSPPPAAYDGSSVGSGVVTTFSVNPSIFDPLVQAGGPYAEATLSSLGGSASHAIAAQLFPGKFAIGAVGCSGLKGWVQATYPPADKCTTDQSDTLYRSPHSDLASGSSTGAERTTRETLDTVLNTVLDRVTITAGRMNAHAMAADSVADVRTIDYELRTEPSGPPIVSIGDLRVLGIGAQKGSAIVNDVTVAARDISILDGVITIGMMTSRARTDSNGTLAHADASLTFADATVLVDDVRHRATIDEHGIRIDEPDMSRKQELSIEERFEEEMTEAHVRFTVASPVQIVEGADAEASIGGFSIAVGGKIPNVPVPHELAGVLGPIIEQVPTSCITDFEEKVDPEGKSLPQVPLCFGAGAIPGSGSEIVLSLSIGTARAATGAGNGYDFGGGCVTCGGGGGGGYQPPPTTTLGPTVTLPGSETTRTITQGSGSQPTGPLLGVFAKLPSGALLWVGVALLILAVGTALRPSLRHVRAG